MTGLVGDYLSPSLGNAILSKTTNGCELAFEEWSTRLGSTITLIDGPFSGLIKLIVEDNGQKLILDAGQDVYEFIGS